MLDIGSQLMFEKGDWATDEMQRFVPKAFSDINKQVATIIYYKQQWGKVKNHRGISESVKTKRLAGINKIIDKKQEELQGIVSEKILKGKVKDLKSFLKRLNLLIYTEMLTLERPQYSFYC